jgi:hypothetical protein
MNNPRRRERPLRLATLAWVMAAGLSVGVLVAGAGSRTVQAGALIFPTTTTTTIPPTTTTTVPPTTTTLPKTTTTTAPSTPPVAATFSPCSPLRAGGPCNAEPAVLEVTYSVSSSLRGASFSWVPGDRRPASAPEPAASQANLGVTAAPGVEGSSACPGNPRPNPGTQITCWRWPSAVRYTWAGTSWQLNGTYKITPCGGAVTSTSCPALTAYGPRSLGVAVPPASPSWVRAGDLGSSVLVSWHQASKPEPDLVGYVVSRNGTPVYACTTDGAGPAPSTPCPRGLDIQDHPPAGTWAYSVSSLRFGVDAAPKDVIASFPVTWTVHVAHGSSAGGLGAISLPPIPNVGPPQTVAPQGPGPSSGFTPVAPAASDNGALALPFGGSHPATSQAASVTGQSETGPRHTNVDSLAWVALAVIALALAAHVWYLRTELQAAAARASARKQAAAQVQPG